MKRKTHIILLLILPVLLLYPARGMCQLWGNPDSLMPGGMNVGTTMYDDSDNAFLFGAELSLLPFFGNDLFAGIYADYIFSSGEHRFSVGPEYLLLQKGTGSCLLGMGVDGGFLYVRQDEGRSRYGFTGRIFFVSLFLVLPYMRYSYVHDSENYIELGCLIKFPVPLD